MAAVAQLQAAKQPPIPFQPAILYQDYPTTRLIHHVTYTAPPSAAAVAAAATAVPPLPPPPPTVSAPFLVQQDTTFCPDASDNERLIRVIEDFLDAANESNLNLHDGVKHRKTRDVLGGDLKHTWDAVVQAAKPAILDADYSKNIRDFLAMYLPSNAFLIQQEHMLHATKPYHMSCFAAASRLRLINALSIHLPGSNGERLYPNATSLKNAFYRLMLPTWQLRFSETGNQLDDATYTFQRLVAFMEQQRLHHNAAQSLQQNQNRRKYNGGYNNNSRSQRPRYDTVRSSHQRDYLDDDTYYDNGVDDQEPDDDTYYHDEGNHYALTQEYDNEDGFDHDDGADCYHQDDQGRHNATY